MHIIGIIVAVIGGILFVLWRMQQAANATRDIAEAAGEVQGLFRRWQWSRKASKHPLETVTDPKEAAAAMLVAVAQADGPLTEAESTVIRTRMSSVFGASRTEAEELLARGRWLTKDFGRCRQRLPPRASGGSEIPGSGGAARAYRHAEGCSLRQRRGRPHVGSRHRAPRAAAAIMSL